MKLSLFILFTVLLSFYSDDVSNKNLCKCENDEDLIAFLKSGDKNQLILCGNIEERISENRFVISDYKIINCVDMSVPVDMSGFAYLKDIVTLYKDSFTVAYTQFILNNEWETVAVPAIENSVKIIDGKPYLSPNRNVFSIPPLSKEQKDSLETLIHSLQKTAETGEALYPYDENTLYLLLMGAVNGNEKAKFLLKNLDTLFILDGAVSETMSEFVVDF
jgi:hypothetical protein